MKKVKQQPVSLVTIGAINNLRKALKKEFGTQFRYEIHAKGKLVALSKQDDGYVEPEMSGLGFPS